MKNFARTSLGILLSLSVVGMGCDNQADQEVIPVLVNLQNEAETAVRDLSALVGKKKGASAALRLDAARAQALISSLSLTDEMGAESAPTSTSGRVAYREPVELSEALQMRMAGEAILTAREAYQSVERVMAQLTTTEDQRVASWTNHAIRNFITGLGNVVRKKRTKAEETYNPWDQNGDDDTTVVNPLFSNDHNEPEVNPLFHESIELFVSPPGSDSSVSGVCDASTRDFTATLVNETTGKTRKINVSDNRFQFSLVGDASEWSIYSLALKVGHGEEGMRVSRCRVTKSSNSNGESSEDTRPLTESEAATLSEMKADAMKLDEEFNSELSVALKQIQRIEADAERSAARDFLNRLAKSYADMSRGQRILDQVSASGVVNDGIMNLAEHQLKTSFAVLLGTQEVESSFTQTTTYAGPMNVVKARHDVALNAIRNMK